MNGGDFSAKWAARRTDSELKRRRAVGSSIGAAAAAPSHLAVRPRQESRIPTAVQFDVAAAAAVAQELLQGSIIAQSAYAEC